MQFLLGIQYDLPFGDLPFLIPGFLAQVVFPLPLLVNFRIRVVLGVIVVADIAVLFDGFRKPSDFVCQPCYILFRFRGSNVLPRLG